MKEPGSDHWGDDEPSAWTGEANKNKEGMLGRTFCRRCMMHDNSHADDCPRNN